MAKLSWAGWLIIYAYRNGLSLILTVTHPRTHRTRRKATVVLRNASHHSSNNIVCIIICIFICSIMRIIIINNKYILLYSLSTAWPQPAVTQTVPGGKRSSRDGKQITLTLSLRRTGLDSLTIAMSRLNVLGAAIAPHFTTHDTAGSVKAPDTPSCNLYNLKKKLAHLWNVDLYKLFLSYTFLAPYTERSCIPHKFVYVN